MLDILKRIAIGVAIGLSIFFLKGAIKVHALSVDFDFAEPVRIHNSRISPVLQPNQCSGSNLSYQFKDFTLDVPYYNTEYNYMFFNYVNYSVSFDPLTAAQETHLQDASSFVWILFRDSSGNQTGATNCLMESGSLVCTLRKNEYFYGFRFNYPCWIDANYYIKYSIPNYGTPLISKTEITAQNISEIKDSINDDTDRSGSGTSYDSSGVTSNTNKEDSLTENAEEDIDSFDIDFSTISSGFQYLLGLFSNICQANIKLFGMILSLLGFGFIGLVLGR